MADYSLSRCIRNVNGGLEVTHTLAHTLLPDVALDLTMAPETYPILLRTESAHQDVVIHR